MRTSTNLSGDYRIWQGICVTKSRGEQDQRLLHRFAEKNDQGAFRELLEKYASLAYGSALRLTRDHMLAEDAAQRVFVAMAKKAHRLCRSRQPIASWLHTAAVLEAKSIMRVEKRHRRKIHSLQRETNEPPTNESPFSDDVLLTLDGAIEKLSANERHLLFLRFFEGRDFRDIACLLGKTEAACQKQGQRLLQKLAHRLSRKGVAVTVAVLAAGLQAELANTSPRGFTHRVSERIAQVEPTSSSGILLPLNEIVVSLCWLMGILAAVFHGVFNAGLADQVGDLQATATSRLPFSVPRSTTSFDADLRQGTSTLSRFRASVRECTRRPDLIRPRLQFIQALYRLDPKDLPHAADR